MGEIVSSIRRGAGWVRAGPQLAELWSSIDQVDAVELDGRTIR